MEEHSFTVAEARMGSINLRDIPPPNTLLIIAAVEHLDLCRELV